ncbi:hypothetical protein [Halobacillus sp. A5]|uniref:hypothetical protein n=1 Tax=Halobacillus sp. A5 TaxID=2880263 RepID=UPI0020A6C61D|nr:hypothetical protein [Halobacillus sp. A5]MCP3026430.1 hypothetical protein [Halobacillus sp. A5]
MAEEIHLKVWVPIQDFSGDYLEKVKFVEDREGLEISLENEEQEFKLIYNNLELGNFVFALKLSSELVYSHYSRAARKARKEFFGRSTKHWFFYKAIRSDFLEWFTENSGLEIEKDSIEHHIISTSETTFEILSSYTPEVITTNKTDKHKTE